MNSVRRSRDVIIPKVSERIIPQYRETIKIFNFNGTGSFNRKTFSQDMFESFVEAPPLDTRKVEPFLLIHMSKQPVLTQAECQAIIDECEAYAKEQDWRRTRHFAYPTTDLSL